MGNGVVVGAVGSSGRCCVGGLLIGFRRGGRDRAGVIVGSRVVVMVVVVACRRECVDCWGEVLKLRRIWFFRCWSVPAEILR